MRPAPSPSGRASRWLLPREHGAYAEVAFPLLTAGCLGRASVASVALALAVVAAFLAHEPLLIAIGARGGAARRECGSRARAQAALLGATSVAAGVLGLSQAAPAVYWAVAAQLPLVASALGLTLSSREKSVFGESVIAVTLAGAGVPVALAAGVPLQDAARAAVAWSAVFLVGIGSVHALIARKKRGALAPGRAVIAVCAALALGAALTALYGHGGWLLSALPMLLVSAGALLIGLPPKRLKLFGWAMVIAHVGAAVGLWICLRREPPPSVEAPRVVASWEGRGSQFCTRHELCTRRPGGHQ